MATIKDVAKRAQVSTATVSYVVNKSRYVSPKLTERVQKAIASFGSWEKSPKKSVGIVNDMRREEGRNYADRTDRH